MSAPQKHFSGGANGMLSWRSHDPVWGAV
jgi:hypothetical protein